MANEYCGGLHDFWGVVSARDYVGIIENCAVAGYEVVDESNKPVTPGETAIGGLAVFSGRI